MPVVLPLLQWLPPHLPPAAAVLPPPLPSLYQLSLSTVSANLISINLFRYSLSLSTFSINLFLSTHLYPNDLYQLSSISLSLSTYLCPPSPLNVSLSKKVAGVVLRASLDWLAVASAHLAPWAPLLFCVAGAALRASLDRLAVASVCLAPLAGGYFAWQAQRVVLSRLACCCFRYLCRGAALRGMSCLSTLACCCFCRPAFFWAPPLCVAGAALGAFLGWLGCCFSAPGCFVRLLCAAGAALRACLPRTRTPKLLQISFSFCKTGYVKPSFLIHATFGTMRLLGLGFHAWSVFMCEKRATCSKGNKLSRPFQIFSCLFHSCLSQRNKTRENCDRFLQRGIASLFLDLRLPDVLPLSVTLFSLRLGFLGRHALFGGFGGRPFCVAGTALRAF